MTINGTHYRDYVLEISNLVFHYFVYYEPVIFFRLLILFRLIRKDSDAGKDWGQKEKGVTENEIVGQHHWLNGDMSLSKLWEMVKDREV